MSRLSKFSEECYSKTGMNGFDEKGGKGLWDCHYCRPKLLTFTLSSSKLIFKIVWYIISFEKRLE